MEGRIKLGKRLCAWLLRFALLLGLAPGVVIRAEADAEKTVWEGSEQISWNADIPGTQFETPEGTFSGLAKGDVITVSTTVTEGNYGDPQYTVTYKAGDEWKWTDLTVNVSGEGAITYTVESDQIATEIAQRGLIFRGQAYTITKITVEASGSSSSGGEGGQGGGETSTHTITLKAFDGDAYAANFTNDAFDPDGTEGTDCRSYTYVDGESTTVTVQYVVWSNRYLQKIVVDGVKQTVTGQNQTFTFNDSADHTITAYYKYSSTPLSAGDIAIDPPWSFTSGTEGWSRGYDWNYGATTTLDHDASKGRLTLTGVDYTKQNDKDHLNDAGKLSVGFNAAAPFTLAKGTNCLKLKLGYNFSEAAEDLTVKVTLKSPGDTEVAKEAARLVSVSDSGSSEVSVLFPALTADTQIKSVTLDIYSATYKGNLWIDDVSFAHVDTCKITLSTDNGKWLNIFQVNGQPISVDNDDAKTVVLVEKDSDVTVTVARRPDGDKYWLTALHVDGFKQTVTEQIQTVTLRASVDHTITAYYEYSDTPITPIAPAVSATPVTTTTTSDDTATVDESAASAVTSALTDHKAAGITAKDANNVALDAKAVNALAAGGSGGSNGVVAVIETHNATVEAPAAMFENAKDEAVTLNTASIAADDNNIKKAVGNENTGKVKGALDISLVKTDSTNEEVEIEVDLGADAPKPITIRTTVAKGLTKRLLHIGYLKDGNLVYNDTVQFLDYDSASGELSFTTTHYTTFVFVSDPSLNFYNGRLTVKNKAVGFNATDWALENGTLSVDKSGRLSMTGLALPTQPGYSDDGSEYASTSYSSGDYYVLKWADGVISNLRGVDMVDLTIDYDLSQIEKDSGDDKWGSVTDLLVSVLVRGEVVGNCKALSLDTETDGGTVEVTFDLDTMSDTVVGDYDGNTPELEFKINAIGYGGSYSESSSVQISDIRLYSVTKYSATFSATVGFDHVEDSAFKMGGLSVFGWTDHYSAHDHTRKVGSPVVVSANIMFPENQTTVEKKSVNMV